ncbi:asparaginyl endopeptidase 1 [Tanacetum coccineum]
MTGSRLTCLLLVLLITLVLVHALSHVDVEETRVDEHMGNGTRWESLEDIANRIRFDMLGIKQKDIYMFSLWDSYKRSSRSERASIVDEIRETFAYMAHLEKSLNMIGLLLFGPQNGTTIIRSTRGPGLPVVDNWECYRSTVELFEKHCGLITEYAMDHMFSTGTGVGTTVSFSLSFPFYVTA